MLAAIRNLFVPRPQPQALAACDQDARSEIHLMREELSKSDREIQRQLRRLSLNYSQQAEKVSDLEDTLNLLRFELRGENALILKTEACLIALDRLSGLIEHLDPGSDAHRLARELESQLLSESSIQPICIPGEPYPDADCEVLGTLVGDDTPPGTVLKVIQQGYRNASGLAIRRAKVIVANSLETT